MKYGIVPSDVMVETYSSDNTSRMSNLIGLKLKEYGLELRDAKGSKPEALAKRKTEMLGEIYRMLVLNLGEPPTKFTWTRKDASGKPVETKEYTPQSFYQEFVGEDLKNNYVMLMNDPSRDYYKLYEIDYDRHAYDGKNWTYVNLPIEDIKQMAIASIKDSTMMYFSCDVGKFLNSERGLLDVKNYDYESLYALDLELFNQQLQALLRGEEVELPRFNFALGKKEFKGDKLKIEDNTILILEGIHALNPELTPHIPAERKFKIYVSALTTISLDDHNWIPTTDNRLLRRIIRDFNYRGYSARETISRWPSVRAGEDKWIFPYQENADVMFNSALLFEFAVLRLHAEPILMGVPRNCPEYCEAYRLLKFIKYFVPVQDKEIPPTSLLREFLGGSSFKY